MKTSLDYTRRSKLDYAAIYDIVRNSTPATRGEFAERYDVTVQYISSIATGNSKMFHPAAIQARKDRVTNESQGPVT